MSLVSSEEQLEALMGGLNRRGLRERALLAALRKRRAALAEAMRAQPPKFVPDLGQVPRLPGGKTERLEDAAAAAAIRSACGQVTDCSMHGQHMASASTLDLHIQLDVAGMRPPVLATERLATAEASAVFQAFRADKPACGSTKCCCTVDKSLMPVLALLTDA